MGTRFKLVLFGDGLEDRLADTLRVSDAEELNLSCGLPPRQAVREAVRCSSEWWFLLSHGRPVCVGGVAPLGEIGVPWFLASDDLDTDMAVRRKVAKLSRRAVSRWREQFASLQNHVLAGRSDTHRWLRWLGFELGDPEIWGVGHAEFCSIYQEGLLCPHHL